MHKASSLYQHFQPQALGVTGWGSLESHWRQNQWKLQTGGRKNSSICCQGTGVLLNTLVGKHLEPCCPVDQVLLFILVQSVSLLQSFHNCLAP